MAQDLRPAFEAVQEAFGVPATVRRPGPLDTPLAATLVWITPVAADVPGGDALVRRMEPQELAAVAFAEVPTVPKGTRIVAPHYLGGPVRQWQVDDTDRVEHDHVVVVLLPIPDVS